MKSVISLFRGKQFDGLCLALVYSFIDAESVEFEPVGSVDGCDFDENERSYFDM